ncbi:MAG TPA: hypothetical protein VHS09_11055 [Polyangiaceae bacterium]|jgi:hypothetical protein|nr:hypothetical protein [Polyangiaceae bacterium]
MATTKTRTTTNERGGPTGNTIEVLRAEVLRWEEVLAGLQLHLGPSAHEDLRRRLEKRYNAALEALGSALREEDEATS